MTSLNRHIVQTTMFGGTIAPKRAKTSHGFMPCNGCPMEEHKKIMPQIPPDAKVVVIQRFPSADGDPRGANGKLLSAYFAKAGLDPDTEVAWANLTRCKPTAKEIEAGAWGLAQRRCRALLDGDIGSVKRDGVRVDPVTSIPIDLTPLVLIGEEPVSEFLSNNARGDSQLWCDRGLWIRTKDRDRTALSTFNVSDAAKLNADQKRELLGYVKSDIRRAVEGLRSVKDPDQNLKMEIFESPFKAQKWLKEFLPKVRKADMFIFDVETYDRLACPSRFGVATQPTDKDCMMAGVALAISDQGGAFIYTRGQWNRAGEAREILSPIFETDTPKGGQNGGFDEEVLTFVRGGKSWVRRVNNRCVDTMLGMIALGDTVDPRNFRLQTAIVDLLGEAEHWVGVNKAYMAKIPMEDMARGAIYDAVKTYAVAHVVEDMLRRGEYF